MRPIRPISSASALHKFCSASAALPQLPCDTLTAHKSQSDPLGVSTLIVPSSKLPKNGRNIVAEYEAVIVTRLKGADLTKDGSHAIFLFDDEEGMPLNLAVPHRMLHSLIVGASHQATQSAKMRNHDPAEKPVFRSDMWELGWAPDGSLALTFRISGGAELTVLIARNRLTLMREVLEAMEDEAPARLRSVTRQ
jgi:hypothetical protein